MYAAKNHQTIKCNCLCIVEVIAPSFLISLYIVLEKDIVNLHISITTTHFLDEDDHRHVSKDELAEDKFDM